MNTEIMMVWEIERGVFSNRALGFKGTLIQAKQFAEDKHFGGGVEAFLHKQIDHSRGRFVYPDGVKIFDSKGNRF